MDKIIFLGYEVLSAFVPFLVVFLILRATQKRKGVSYSHYHFWMILVFAIYIIGVCHFTGAGTLYDGLIYKLEFRQEQINFIPFSQDIDIVAYLLNIVLFIPLGLLAPIIWKKMNKLINVIGIGLFFTILIEITQLLNNRRTDIDDILLNVLGAVLGFGFFKVWDRVTKSKYQIDSPMVIELPICFIVVLVGRFFIYNEMGLAKLLYGF
ncbi:MAG: VanZ family protein [Lachnospiraceae bacterium]|nr:VanZ family protein [Lachnospiraceae bacterium]